MEHFLRTYGYAGVFLSTFFGAEEGVIVAGFLAAQGFLSLPWIILVSALGGSLGDQIYFYLALLYGERLLNWSTGIRKSYLRAQRLAEKYGSWIVLASRFLAGIRISVSVLFGILKMAPVKYTTLNFLSGILWASLWGLLSYRFGRAILTWLPKGKHWILWVLLLAILVFVIAARIQNERNTPPTNLAGPVLP